MNDITDTKYVKVFIGRFQPFHLGHLKVLRAAVDTADHVVVIIGSVNAEPSLKNPWSFLERRLMVLAALTPKEREKVSIGAAYDMPGRDADWVRAVRKEARVQANRVLGTRGKRAFTLIGCHKGADTYYLKLYRGWNRDLIPQSEAMNATDIREAFFTVQPETDPPAWWAKVPGSSAVAMSILRENDWSRFCRCARQLETLRAKRAEQQITEAEAKEKP